MLEDAEARYGSRDPAWLFGGINYTTAATGPAVRIPKNGRKVAVLCLTDETFNNFELRRWQLSHEVVHLLGPTNRDVTTVFEEGLASYEQFRTSIAGYTGENLFTAKYQEAFDLVRPIVQAHPNGVRTLRAEHGILSPLQPEWLHKHLPNVTKEAAQRLSEPFYASVANDAPISIA